MRTTVNIQDEAFELCKRKARQRGVTIGHVISEAILATYRERPAPARGRQYDLPVSGSGGLRPGVDLDNTAALEDVMEGQA